MEKRKREDDGEPAGVMDQHQGQEDGPPAKKNHLGAVHLPKQPLDNTVGTPAVDPSPIERKKKKRRRQKKKKRHQASGGAVLLQRLNFQTVLGEGSFGKVFLASDLKTNKQLAVKVVRKRAMLRRLEGIFVERRVLEVATGSAFLTQAYGTFQTKDHLYFVMEYVSGGDLFSYLEKNGSPDLCTTTFFAAEMVCGMQYLHERGIIHRDLKPENILLTGEGHLKIADFGLALEGIIGQRTARGYAGTVGFIAPEIYQGHDYNAAVDWWSFGVILYEMSTGEEPFYCGDTRGLVVRSTLEDTPFYPEYLSPATKDVLIQLLCKNPARRLGATGQIRSHLFFESIDWEELEAGTLDSPVSLTSSLDSPTQQVVEGRAISSSEAMKTPLGSNEQQLFNGFSFTSTKWAI